MNEQGGIVSSTLKMEVDPQGIIDAVKRMPRKERDDFIEDLLAATDPAYLASIREAREDYRAGRTSSHEDVFGR